MHARPFYRWKSFWLGVFVLGFLGWSWVTGLTVSRWVVIATPNFTITPSQFDGALGIAVDVRRGMWGMEGEANERRSVWFPGPWEFEMEVSPPAHIWPYLRLRVAHWVIMPLFLLPWTAFLAWRWRRMRRLAR